MLKMSIAKEKLSDIAVTSQKVDASKAVLELKAKTGDGRPAQGKVNDGQGSRGVEARRGRLGGPTEEAVASLSRPRRTRMAGFADYEAYDALGLADLVRRRKVTPTELLDAAIERVEARNPTINAVVLPLYDYARKAIADGLPDGPFRGVPYLLKDLTASLAGVQHDAGLPLLRGHAAGRGRQRARRAAEARRAGRLRADQLVRARALAHLRAAALRRHQEPVGPDPHLGRLERRRGRRHRRPHRADGARERRLRIDPRAGGVLRARRAQADPRAEHDGAVHRRGAGRPLHRARRDPQRPRHAQRSSTRPRARGRATRTPRHRPARPFLAEVGAPARPPPDRLDRPRAERRAGRPRVRRRWSGRPPRSAASLGHEVSEADPEIERDAVVPTFLTHRRRQLRRERPDPSDRRPPSPARRGRERHVRHGGAGREDLGAQDYVRATQTAHRLGRQMAAFHRSHDVLLTPGLATPGAVKLGWIDMMLEDVDEYWRRVFTFSPFTVWFNITGQPAIMLPVRQVDTAGAPRGLPLAIQLVARFGDEATLFRLSAQLEAARPWFDRKPALAG